MDVYEGKVVYEKTSDTGDYDHDHDWKIDFKNVESIISDYEGDRIRLMIEVLPKEHKCVLCEEMHYDDELFECECGRKVCSNCCSYDKGKEDKFCISCQEENENIQED